jgi:predicted DCC family thiol-disulfide oxidoreductase YuxK
LLKTTLAPAAQINFQFTHNRFSFTMLKLDDLSPNDPVMLYDGVCNFCCASVQFVYRNDRSKRIKFLALQSPTAAALLAPFGLSNQDLKSLIVVYRHKVYRYSDAALKIAMLMGGAWPIFRILYIVPRFVRNGLYRLFAQNRYRLFGLKEACVIPKPDFYSRIVV